MGEKERVSEGEMLHKWERYGGVIVIQIMNYHFVGDNKSILELLFTKQTVVKVTRFSTQMGDSCESKEVVTASVV